MVNSLFNKFKSSLSNLSDISGLNSFKSGKTLYYPGCITQHKLKHLLDKYKSLLYDLGIDYVVLPEMVCCGSPLLNAGYKDDFEDVKKKNIEILKKNKISRIITNCPHCFDMFKNTYDLDIEIKHISQVIAENKHKLPSDNNEEVSYHDPCHMVRGQGIAEQPRNLLKMIPGVEFHEMKDADVCCGSAGSYCITHYDTAIKINNHKVKNIQAANINYVATGCPTCVMHIQDNLIQHESPEKVRFVVEMLADSLRERKTI